MFPPATQNDPQQPPGPSSPAAWFGLRPEDSVHALEQIRGAAGPSNTYYVLSVLSTLIATYGLLSNSTATVIGAMIVAPLMGPILGLAMGTVQAERKLISQAILAEATGIVAVVATAGLVAWAVSPDAIDYWNREISARTSPTVYDLAIGFAAGLAGAYASVNRRISSSIAGVAIAVALVPPLAVTGLCLAGSLHTPALLGPTLNSFMLFLANLLTIETAAVVVFLLAGYGEFRRFIHPRTFFGHFGISLLLLVPTAGFLTHQLNARLEERNLEQKANQIMSAALSRIPGASVDLVTVTRQGKDLAVRLIAYSPQEVPSDVVEGMERQLSQKLGRNVQLMVQTVVSTYTTTGGRVYEPRRPEAQPDPQQVFLEKLGESIRTSLESFPGAELVQFRELAGAPAPEQDQPAARRPRRFLLVLRSPYVFDPPRVALLQRKVQESLGALLDADSITLVVRTTLSRDASATAFLEAPAPEVPDSRKQELEAIATRTRRTLETWVRREPRAALLDVQIASPEAAGLPTEILATVQAPRLIPQATARVWQQALGKSLDRKVILKVESRLGVVVDASAPASAVKVGVGSR